MAGLRSSRSSGLCLFLFFIALFTTTVTALRSQTCPPGKEAQVLSYICVVPDPPCAKITHGIPSGTAIRAVLAKHFVNAPAEVRDMLADGLSFPDSYLEMSFTAVLGTARCVSGGQAGPADPNKISDDEIKAWLLEVLTKGSPEQRIFRPIVARLPPSFIAGVYRDAVVLKRRAEGK